MDARHVCEHSGDCSIWKIHPVTNQQCCICDCGALRRAFFMTGKGDAEYDDLQVAWFKHLEAIDRSMEEK